MANSNYRHYEVSRDKATVLPYPFCRHFRRGAQPRANLAFDRVLAHLRGQDMRAQGTLDDISGLVRAGIRAVSEKTL